MHGLSEKQFKSKTIFDLNNNMRQIKMKLVTIIDQLYYNLHFTLYGENYWTGMLKKKIHKK